MKLNPTTIADCTVPTRTVDPSKWSGDFTYIDISSVNRESKRIEDPKLLPTAEAPSRARKEVRLHDVLVSTVRPNLNAVAIVDQDLPRLICSTGFSVLRADSTKLHYKYLFFRTLTEEFVSDMVGQAKGAGYPAVSDRIVGSHRLPHPLPPLQEQHRIVEILDQADALRQQRRQADEIARKILPALFQEMFGDRPWPKLPVSTILRDIQGGWSPVCESRAPEPDEWGVLKLGSATYCEYRASEAKALPPDQSPRPDLEVKAGDLLFTRKNTQDLVGASAYVFETPSKRTIPDLIFRLIPDLSLVDPIYLWQALIEPTTRDAIRSLASGAAASMVNISRGRLLPLELPVPPLELQKKFAAAVISLRAPQQAQTASAANLETLFQTLLHHAFAGSLTAKWREAHAKELLQEMEHQAR